MTELNHSTDRILLIRWRHGTGQTSSFWLAASNMVKLYLLIKHYTHHCSMTSCVRLTIETVTHGTRGYCAQSQSACHNSEPSSKLQQSHTQRIECISIIYTTLALLYAFALSAGEWSFPERLYILSFSGGSWLNISFWKRNSSHWFLEHY